MIPLLKAKTKEEKLKKKIAKLEQKEKEKRYKKLAIRKDQEVFLEKKPDGFNKGFVFGQSRIRDQRVEKEIVGATLVLIPNVDPYWKVDNIFKKKKSIKSQLIFKSEISEKKLEKLRESAPKTPGATRMEVKKFLEVNHRNRDLYMLSAICTNKMLKNTKGEKKDIVDGLKLAVIDAATAVVSDGLSLYNLQHFFEIYFRFLEQLKVYQTRVYASVNSEGPYAELRVNLSNAMQINDLLYEKKEGCFNMLSFVSKNFNKSSQMHTRFDLLSIRRGVEYINAGLATKKMELGTAEEVINTVMGILTTLVKVPILEPFIEQATKYLGGSNSTMKLKVVGIHSSRLLFEFRVAVILREMDTMKKLARRVFQLNLALIKTVKKRSIRHQSEYDPYQNLAHAIEFSANVMDKSTQETMIKTAVKWLGNVSALDSSKDIKFARNADETILRLDALLYAKMQDVPFDFESEM
ncbi:MAG: hypothetical protein QNL04_14565, partial [SAR324 cluster bacterium]|nr:hypothetical protein [SAR324 cluster bacterium]